MVSASVSGNCGAMTLAMSSEECELTYSIPRWSALVKPCIISGFCLYSFSLHCRRYTEHSRCRRRDLRQRSRCLPFQGRWRAVRTQRWSRPVRRQKHRLSARNLCSGLFLNLLRCLFRYFQDVFKNHFRHSSGSSAKYRGSLQHIPWKLSMGFLDTRKLPARCVNCAKLTA